MMLVKYVHGAMARYISSRFAIDGRLNVLMINAQYEDVIRRSIHQAAGGYYLHLQPEKSDDIIQSFTRH